MEEAIPVGLMLWLQREDSNKIYLKEDSLKGTNVASIHLFNKKKWQAQLRGGDFRSYQGEKSPAFQPEKVQVI